MAPAGSPTNTNLATALTVELSSMKLCSWRLVFFTIEPPPLLFRFQGATTVSNPCKMKVKMQLHMAVFLTPVHTHNARNLSLSQ